MTIHQDGQQLTLKAGESLFEQGSPSDFAYRVVSGQLQALRFHETDEEAEEANEATDEINEEVEETKTKIERSILGEISAGSFVGELGLLQGNARSAAVIALEETVLECFGRERFIGQVTKDAKLALELIQTLSFRTRSFFDVIDELIEGRRSTAWSEQFGKIFQSVFGILRRGLVAVRSKQDDRRVLDMTEFRGHRLVAAGTVLFHEGAPSLWAAQVLKGRLEARKKIEMDWVVLGEIESGQLVGELGLLQKRQRSATVVVIEDAELEFFNEETLVELLLKNLEKRQRVIEDLSKRSIRLVALLSEIAVHEDLTGSPLPKRIHSVLDSVEDVVYLARDVVIHDLRRLQQGLNSEAKSVGVMFATYRRYLRNEASEKELDEANWAFRNLLKTLGLGTLFLLPGGLITIPLVVKLGQRFGVELLPDFQGPSADSPSEKNPTSLS